MLHLGEATRADPTIRFDSWHLLMKINSSQPPNSSAELHISTPITMSSNPVNLFDQTVNLGGSKSRPPPTPKVSENFVPEPVVSATMIGNYKFPCLP